MPTLFRLATTAAVSAALVAGSVLAAPAISPASAVTTPTPSPTATATPATAPSATATATPTAGPAPRATVPPAPDTADDQPLPGEDPSLATMNAARNHTMGSTIPVEETGAGTAKVRSLATGQPAGIQGLDVSGWQVLTLAKWKTIYANGARFVYVKATESTDYRSSQFAEQYNDSYAAGLAHGAYHFATPNTSSGATQANYFVNNGGGWSSDGRTLPPLLDIEYNPYGATCYGLSAAAMVAWIRDFSNTILSRTGRLPAIYSTTDWWTRCTGNSAAFGANPLFIARYPSNISSGAGTLPAGWSRYTMWQYADAGIYPGDQDVFNGTQAQLTAFAKGTSSSGGGSTPLPPPAPSPLISPIIGAGDLDHDGKPDFIARRPDGTLWFYAGTGSTANGEGYKPAVRIGSGWNTFTAIIGVGDFNGDKKADILGRKSDGTLWFYAGTNGANSTPTFGAAIKIGTGWNIYTEITAAGDLDGNGKPDLVGRRADGTLWYYAGTGSVSATAEGYGRALQIGTGWNIFAQLLSVGDLDRDGKADLVGVTPAGVVYFYAGTRKTSGTDAWLAKGRILSISSIKGAEALAAPGDMTGDGIPDLLVRSTAGALLLVPGSSVGDEGYAAGKASTGGWNVNATVLGTGDFTGDGKADLIATRSGGTLWLYPGTGTLSASGAVFGAAVKIGNSGWNSYTKLIAPGDFNGDGKSDLLAIGTDGALWFYAGTGVVSGGKEGYAPRVKIGRGGWGVYDTVIGAGDFNSDGKRDLLARRADGSLWFYAGTGVANATHEGYKPAVKIATGWQAFDLIVAAGDFNGDGKADLLARRPSGTLSFFAGTGKPSATSTGYAAETTIGKGWNVMKTVVGGADLDGDRRNDLVGIRTDGSSLFYSGTGSTGQQVAAFSASQPIGSGWLIYQ